MYRNDLSEDRWASQRELAPAPSPRPRPRRRRRRRRRSGIGAILPLVCVLLAALYVVPHIAGRGLLPSGGTGGELPKEIAAFASQNGLTAQDYPQEIVALLERNPETEDFVLNYPLEHGKPHDGALTEEETAASAPLFLQWDKRWGYLDYGGSVVVLSGCGPVCLSMAGYSLTRDEDTFRPDKVVQFALDHGYCVPGNGSKWTLISEGGEELGLDVTELPLDENRMVRALEAGQLIICIMGPGVFTTTGHYIVLTGVEDGKFQVNDPNSRENSQKLWDYAEFADQIRNLWAIGA